MSVLRSGLTTFLEKLRQQCSPCTSGSFQYPQDIAVS